LDLNTFPTTTLFRSSIHLVEGAGNTDIHSSVDHVSEVVASNEKEGVGKEESQRSKKIAKTFSSGTYRTGFHNALRLATQFSQNATLNTASLAINSAQ